MSISAFEAAIIDLVAKDELQKAISYLSAHLQEDEHITLLSARYHSIQNDYTNGIIEYEDFQKTMNQLRINILSFAKKAATTTPQPTLSIENQYRISFARICILWILYNEKDNPPTLNVTKIYARSQLGNRKHIADSIYEMEKQDLIRKQKVGSIICWKLTEKGVALAQELENSLLFNAGGK